MEMVLNGGFFEMTQDEMLSVDGGSKTAAQGILIIGGALFLCIGAPIACVAAGGSALAFATAYLMGVNLMGSALFL